MQMTLEQTMKDKAKAEKRVVRAALAWWKKNLRPMPLYKGKKGRDSLEELLMACAALAKARHDR